MSGIYLDYAAATPLDPAVFRAMEPYFSEKFQNPSASYLSARSIRQELQAARAVAAVVLGVRPAELIFTAGATEANNLAIQGVMRQFPKAEILTSAIEHESILAPAGLFTNQQIPVDGKGVIKLNLLSNLINDCTVMLSVMLVNNELGTIQPLREIADLIKAVLKQRRASGNKLPLYLHTDAAQAGNYLDLHASRLGVDLMSLNGGKIYGPKQSGALYIKAGTKLMPLIVGGGQEFGLRSGTENMAGLAGFSKALDLAAARRIDESQRVNALRSYFQNQISDKLPRAVINGASRHRAPHILSVSFAGIDNERLMMELDENSVACALGSACSASSDQPSHVLAAIGLNDEQIRSSLRFSLGRQTSQADLDKVLGLLQKLTHNNR